MGGLLINALICTRLQTPASDRSVFGHSIPWSGAASSPSPRARAAGQWRKGERWKGERTRVGGEGGRGREWSGVTTRSERPSRRGGGDESI